MSLKVTNYVNILVETTCVSILVTTVLLVLFIGNTIFRISQKLLLCDVKGILYLMYTVAFENAKQNWQIALPNWTKIHRKVLYTKTIVFYKRQKSQLCQKSAKIQYTKFAVREKFLSHKIWRHHGLCSFGNLFITNFILYVPILVYWLYGIYHFFIFLRFLGIGSFLLKANCVE